MSALFETTLPALAFELTIKSLLLLAVVMSVTWFMRRSSAAVRHLYFTVAALALVALPAAVLLLPPWQPEFLPEPIEAVFAPAAVTGGLSPGEESGGFGQTVDSRAGGAAPASTPGRGPDNTWHKWFFLVWLSGAMILVLGLALGKLYGFLAARKAHPVTDQEFLHVLEEAAVAVGLNRKVTVLESGRFVVPSVAGIFRSKLLVPPQAAFWPRDRLRAVLQHELSHVKRNDILIQFLSQAACCFYWLNPLTWILERKIFIERERACDDMALSLDVKASDYAGFLMEVLEEMGNKRNKLWVTAAMAEGTDFKDRILSVLNPVAQRTLPRGGHLFTAAALALVLVLPLSVLRPWTTDAAAGMTDRSAVIAQDTEDGGDRELRRIKTDDERIRSRSSGLKKSIPVSALIEQLRNGSAVLRERAAAALGESRDRRAVLPLIEALNDNHPSVREHAAMALGKLGDNKAVLPLCDLLANDRDANVREHAAAALGYIGDDRAHDSLLKAMESDPNMSVREHAFSALRRLAGEL